MDGAVISAPFFSRIDDTIREIDDILASSNKVRNDFANQWTSVITEYENKITILNNELAKLPPMSRKEDIKGGKRDLKRKNKKPMRGSNRNISLDVETNESDLPPDSNTNKTNDDCNLSSNMSSLKNRFLAHSPQSKDQKQKQKVEEKRKFMMREEMFGRFERLRLSETEAMKQDGDEGEFEYDQFVQKNSTTLLQFIAQYKPQIICKQNTRSNNRNSLIDSCLTSSLQGKHNYDSETDYSSLDFETDES